MWRRWTTLATALLLGACTVAPAPTFEPPSQVDGLPVITISEAVARRDAGEAGPMAVGGWYTRGPAHPCPAPALPDGRVRDPHPLELWCREEDVVLAELPETSMVVTERDGAISMESRELTGPAIHPMVGQHDDALFPPGARTWDPIPVVFVGHFGDPGAFNCLPELRRTCLERFVVDRLIQIPWPPR